MGVHSLSDAALSRIQDRQATPLLMRKMQVDGIRLGPSAVARSYVLWSWLSKRASSRRVALHL